LGEKGDANMGFKEFLLFMVLVAEKYGPVKGVLVGHVALVG
jgi:hypothetical protein